FLGSYCFWWTTCDSTRYGPCYRAVRSGNARRRDPGKEGPMRPTTKHCARFLITLLLCLAIAPRVHAQAVTPISSTRCGDGLKSFGPPSPFGYPSYYVDQGNFALAHCDQPLSIDPLCGNPDFGDPLGEGLPLGPVPDVATGNFWAEQFYMLATAD